jgi:N-acetylglucosaminyl-diphospho-decaprenol L-rhamnosyltransferase
MISSQPVVSIIVVSYNTREMTLACLRSVFEQTTSVNFELLVLDNASSDGSAAAIREAFAGSIDLVASDKNLGFAAGNNFMAVRAKGEYLLLLNPDTLILDRAIDRLVAFAGDTREAGIWGGRTLLGDGTLDPGSCFARQSLWSLVCQVIGLNGMFPRTNFFNPEGIGGWNREGTRHVDIVTGCFLLISRDLWIKLGGFRELFFMYGEEADLCMRAQILGCKPMVTSMATIVHYGGASERVMADKIVRLLKAKMLLIYLYFSPGKRQLGAWLLSLWPVTRYLIHSLLAIAGRKSSIERREVWRSVLDNKPQWSGRSIACQVEGA